MNFLLAIVTLTFLRHKTIFLITDHFSIFYYIQVVILAKITSILVSRDDTLIEGDVNDGVKS